MFHSYNMLIRMGAAEVVKGKMDTEMTPRKLVKSITRGNQPPLSDLFNSTWWFTRNPGIIKVNNENHTVCVEVLWDCQLKRGCLLTSHHTGMSTFTDALELGQIVFEELGRLETIQRLHNSK